MQWAIPLLCPLHEFQGSLIVHGRFQLLPDPFLALRLLGVQGMIILCCQLNALFLLCPLLSCPLFKETMKGFYWITFLNIIWKLRKDQWWTCRWDEQMNAYKCVLTFLWGWRPPFNSRCSQASFLSDFFRRSPWATHFFPVELEKSKSWVSGLFLPYPPPEVWLDSQLFRSAELPSPDHGQEYPFGNRATDKRFFPLDFWMNSTANILLDLLVRYFF